jgi:hypothetical protein
MAGKNAFYAQSGGVTAVISASACGVLQTARQHSDEIGKVYLLTRAAEGGDEEAISLLAAGALERRL